MKHNPDMPADRPLMASDGLPLPVVNGVYRSVSRWGMPVIVSGVCQLTARITCYRAPGEMVEMGHETFCTLYQVGN